MSNNYVSKLIGSGFREIQNKLYSKHEELDKRLQALNEEIDNIVEERLNNYYQMEAALKQEGVTFKYLMGNRVYILNEEGIEMYRRLDLEYSSKPDLLSCLLLNPECFIVVETNNPYMEYCKKMDAKSCQ